MGKANRFASVAFNLVLPDEFRLCEQPLQHVSRIPVCPACLSLPQPLHAEYSCKACGSPFINAFSLDEQQLCTFCREGGAQFEASFSFGSYDGPLRELIHLLKYSKVETLAQPLGSLMVRALPVDRAFDCVIPMPMHWRKRWERGFNQAELLAEVVANRRGLPLVLGLRRSRYTKAQAGLTERQRRDNLKGSLVARPVSVEGKRTLLVDDVMTTGATLRAAATALKAAGATHVSTLTLARVDGRRHEFLDSSQFSTRPEVDSSLIAEEEFVDSERE